jgi:hypothetical protein
MDQNNGCMQLFVKWNMIVRKKIIHDGLQDKI